MEKHDKNLKKEYYDESNDLWYELRGDYYYPMIAIPKQEKTIIGKYGRARLNYIKQYKKCLYSELMMTGTLNQHLTEIDKIASQRINDIICEMARKEKESRKKQKVVEVKEIRLSSTIDTHDFEFKAKNARKFLEDGNKVKATIKFKGRELNNTTFGVNVLKKFAEALDEVGAVDKEPKLEGRSMILMINPKNVK